jgi:hypothetical protein
LREVEKIREGTQRHKDSKEISYASKFRVGQRDTTQTTRLSHKPKKLGGHAGTQTAR